MKKIFSIILLFLSTACLWAGPQISVRSVSPLTVSRGDGLAAFFCGTIDGQAVVAGGSNFPDLPASHGGKKHYYDEIRTLGRDSLWHVTGHLPYAVSNGASVTTAKGIFCAGGVSENKINDGAFLITKDSIQMLPSLPVALKDHAAAVNKDMVYVVGGMSQDGYNQNVYALNLAKPESEWQKVAELPDGGRVQPVVTVQTGANGPCLFVISGYGEEAGLVKARVDGISLDLLTLKWKHLANIPGDVTLTGASCINSGYSHIVFLGGVNRQVFEQRMNDKAPTPAYFLHRPNWFKFNDKMWVYHTITDVWYPIFVSNSFARAGAGIVRLPDQSMLLINGEKMPGKRSNMVSKIKVTQPRSFGWLNWSVLAVYLLGMVVLGYVFMKREKGADDFFRGGGRIPWWAAGISIYATMLSALTYMGIPAKAYATNWTYYPMLVTILLISFPVIKYYLPHFRRLKLTSAYEYLEMRFNTSTRLLASGLFIVFMVARMALVLFLPSLALSAVTGINIQLCIVLMGLVTIVYCTMGGVEAVVWGDVIQGIILVGGAIFLAVWLMLNTEGGVEGYFQMAADEHKMRLFEWSLDYRSVTFWVAIVGGLANNLISYTSDQTVIQRYLTTKDEKSAANSILMNGIMCVCVSIVFYFIGTGLYTYFHTHPYELDITMDRGDAILPYFMMAKMPQGVAGLLIAAIFAATMSTISSNINSVSTAFSIDFWKRLRGESNDKSMLRVARISCIVSGFLGVVIALLMANWDILSLIDYFNTILGLLTGGLGGLFFIGVFMPKVNGRSALIGFVAGTLFVFWMAFCTDANLFLYGAAGIAVSVVVAWICSMFLKEDVKKVEV